MRAQDHQQDRNRPSVAVVCDPRGEQAALAVGRMFGHIGRRAAIFAAQRQPCSMRRMTRLMGAAMPMAW
jgi:hypothetical protein